MPQTLQQRLREKALREELRAGLASLPEPQFTYEVVLPDAEDEATEAPAAPFREDAGDVDRRTAEEQAAAEAAEFERRSSALKRDPALPRPGTVDEDAIVNGAAGAAGDAALAKARNLIAAEVVELLQHDAIKFPVKGKPSRKTAPILDAFEDSQLAAAKALIAAEATVVEAEFKVRVLALVCVF